jgi:hypothetical protein
MRPCGRRAFARPLPRARVGTARVRIPLEPSHTHPRENRREPLMIPRERRQGKARCSPFSSVSIGGPGRPRSDPGVSRASAPGRARAARFRRAPSASGGRCAGRASTHAALPRESPLGRQRRSPDMTHSQTSRGIWTGSGALVCSSFGHRAAGRNRPVSKIPPGISPWCRGRSVL